MQAKDITDLAMLRAVERLNGPHDRCRQPQPTEFLDKLVADSCREGHWALVWDLHAAFPDAPHKVVEAKASQLLKRGLLDGCNCGCRGDYELTEDGRAFLAGHTVTT